jgi:hypothetical protein
MISNYLIAFMKKKRTDYLRRAGQAERQALVAKSGMEKSAAKREASIYRNVVADIEQELARFKIEYK